MSVLRAASGVLLPLRGLSTFESDLQIPDISHTRRLEHQQTPKCRFTTQCSWTSPNRMRLVQATQHQCRGRSAKTSPRDGTPRAGAPGSEERHRSSQLSRKHFQKVPIVGIPHALSDITLTLSVSLFLTLLTLTLSLSLSLCLSLSLALFTSEEDMRAETLS